jgi:2-phosphosulfolactate phosphatase
MNNSSINCEWGLNGLKHLAPHSDVIIIVDVLSFSTSVDIAVSNGAEIYPFAYKDKSAAEYAMTVGAELASTERGKQDTYNLSPASLLNIPEGTKLVLPSPNGSELSLAAVNGTILCACLRNCSAVAEYAMSIGSNIAVIPSGEKWRDGSIRFAVEDLIGAGAIIANLAGELSIDAEIALTSFKNFEHNLFEVLEACVSGMELLDRGFEEDIVLASELNFSSSVPLLVNGAYVNAIG